MSRNSTSENITPSYYDAVDVEELPDPAEGTITITDPLGFGPVLKSNQLDVAYSGNFSNGDRALFQRFYAALIAARGLIYRANDNYEADLERSLDRHLAQAKVIHAAFANFATIAEEVLDAGIDVHSTSEYCREDIRVPFSGDREIWSYWKTRLVFKRDPVYRCAAMKNVESG